MVRTRYRTSTGLAVFVLLMAALLPGSGALDRNAGYARGEEYETVPFTILYTSDIKGKIDPCG